MGNRTRLTTTVIKCSRPLIFEHEDFPDTPYSYSGTVFYVVWAGYFFAVTARHVLSNRDLASIRLLCHDSDRTFLGFDSTATADGTEDHKDLAVIAIVETALCPQLLLGIAAMDERNIIDGRRAFAAGEQLVVSGYPGELKEVKYDPEVLAHQRLVATAEYVRSDPDRQHIHELKWTNTCDIHHMAGMSGSPVLCEGYETDFGLAGILIQAGVATSPAHFIDAAVLLKILRWQVDDIRRRGVRGA